MIRALQLRGWAAYRLGDAQAVLALADESLGLCARFGDRRGLPTSYKLMGVAHLQLGHFRQADQFFKKGKRLYVELGDRRNTAAMFSNLGESARLRGDAPAAVRLYQRALAIAHEIGHRESETIYLTNLSGARLALGQFARVEADLGFAISLTADPNSCALSEAYTFLSAALLGQSKLREALEAAQRALRLAGESENELYIGGAWEILGRVTSAVKQERQPPPSLQSAVSSLSLPEPAVCFANSLQVFRKINAEGEVARALRTWAEFDLVQQRPSEARARLEEALQIFERLNATSEVRKSEALLRSCGQV